jgi:hypothetical protein
MAVVRRGKRNTEVLNKKRKEEIVNAENEGISPERVQKITEWMEAEGWIRKTGKL